MFEEIANIIRSFLPKENESIIPLHEPQFSGREWKYVKECIDTGWVSSVGKFVDRFEKNLVDYTGAKYAVVTVNGTAALHICYLLAGIKPNDEVLAPALTFVATCNALHYCGAIPHFIDCDKKYLGIDIEKLEKYLSEASIIKNKTCYNKKTGRIIRALCVMHTFGHPVDLDPLIALSEKYHLKLIEDAAEALGSFYKDKHVGHHGLMGAFSFNGNKIITTGGGGAIITNHADIAKKAKHMTTTAKIPHPYLYQHDEVGYNYRMPNINAALGCAQLEQLSYFLEEKRKLSESYAKAFEKMCDVRFLNEPPYANSNYWLNAIFINNKELKEILLQKLNQENIGVRPAWELMHRLPMYKQAPRMDLSNAEMMVDLLINLPSSVGLRNKKNSCYCDSRKY